MQAGRASRRGVGHLGRRVQRAAAYAVGLCLGRHLVQGQVVGVEIELDRGIQFEIGVDFFVVLGTLGRHVADRVLDLGAGSPGPHAKTACSLDPVLHAKLAAPVFGCRAACIDVKAHRRVDPAAVDHDALHAQHHHRRQLLLPLAGEVAAGERHQLFGVAGLDLLFGRHTEGGPDIDLAGHAGSASQSQGDAGDFVGVGVVFGVWRVVFDRLRKVVGHPLPDLSQTELRALESLGRRRHRIEQLQVLVHLLRIGVHHGTKHAVDEVGHKTREGNRVQHVVRDARNAVGRLAEAGLCLCHGQWCVRTLGRHTGGDLAIGLALLSDQVGRQARHLHHGLRQGLALLGRQRAVVGRAFQHIPNGHAEPRRRRRTDLPGLGWWALRGQQQGAIGRHDQPSRDGIDIAAPIGIAPGVGKAAEAASQRCAATITFTSSGDAGSSRSALSVA